MWKINKGQDLDLAEQTLVNCVPDGCNGGWPATALQFIQKRGGIELEGERKYSASGSGNNGCPVVSLNAPVRGVQQTQSNDKNSFISALRNNGPMAAALQAGTSTFQNYKSGIISCPANAQIDHAILLIGYNQESDYFIGKNSWSTGWGESGYFRISATSNCGLLQNAAAYPSV
jgi:C1A family cysteine protease